jgi:hypothetical protein
MMRRRTNRNEGAMVRRSVPFLATFFALALVLLVAVPAAAYNNVNPLHLRLSRLDPLTCGTTVRIQATLTDSKGDPVSGESIHFAIIKGESGDALAPANDVTDAQGKAVTLLTPICTDETHHIQIVASGPDGAQGRINLILHKDHDNAQAAAGVVAGTTTGSDGFGSGQAGIAAPRSAVLSPVASTGPSSMSLLPVGLLFGLVSVLLTARLRRLSPGTRRPATA